MLDLLDRSALADAQQSYVSLVAALGRRNLPPGGDAGMAFILSNLRPTDRTIVDLGCNTGYVAREIAARQPDATVVGIDIDEAMLEVAAKAISPGTSNLAYRSSLGKELREVVDAADLVVCAGSSAFFLDPIAVLSNVAAALAPGGRFLDAHYVYHPDTPAELHRRAIEAFGLGWSPESLSEALSVYEAAGLRLLSMHSLPSFIPEISPETALFRDIMRNDDTLRPMVDAMTERLDLIEQLSPFRTAVFLEFGRPGAAAASGLQESQGPERDWTAIGAAHLLFSSFYPPMSLAQLDALLPYAFLAYVGDTDAAPGGARAVSDLGRWLRESAGLAAEAQVLDVGCFTGHSTISLAYHFPETLGIDLDPAFVAVARQAGLALGSPARFAEIDARDTGFADGSFDAVVMTATLGYTDEPRRILAEARRVLRREGILVEFLYDHCGADAAVGDAIRTTVSRDIRLRSLAASIAEFESEGFRLVALQRVALANANDHEFRHFTKFIETLERSRDPAKSDAEIDEFIARYERLMTCDGALREPGGDCYRCVFRPAPRSGRGDRQVEVSGSLPS